MERIYHIIDTEWGFMAAVWSDSGLWAMGFPRPSEILAEQDVPLDHAVRAAIDTRGQELRQQLNIYFRGFYTMFDMPIDWEGYTPFQQAVLKAAMEIPYGKTKSYKEIAADAHTPKAARAVGGALHANRTPIVVPCHRVVGTDGSLTGFGGGLDMKKALLLLEKTLS